jgi:hypothetical protein
MTEKMDFTSLNIPISEDIFKCPIEQQREIHAYLSQMDEIHKKAYEIAFQHLGTSFDVVKTNGFKIWQAKR